jgi:uncharacterized phage-associated protein
MLHSPKSIANYFIDIATNNSHLLTPMKLQKLVFYAMGWFAGYTGKPLVDEAVEAWQYGPVFPSLYHEFKTFGSSPIKRKACELNEDFDDVEVPAPADPDVRKFLDNIWNSYNKYTGIALSEMTHAIGTPWERTWSASQGVRNVSIPFEVIKDHFAIAADKARQRSLANA